jgi:sugar phosphate permease
VYFDRVSPSVVATNIQEEFGISATALGIMSSMYFYPYAAMQIPAGFLSDSVGPRRTVSIFFAIAAIGTAVFGLAPTFAVAIVGRFMMGIGVAFVWIPCVRILGNWFRPREFSTLMGLMLTWGNVGALCASAPLAVLVSKVGWRNAFFYLGAVMVAMAVMNALILRNKPSDKGFPTVSVIDGVDYYATGGKEVTMTVRETVPLVLKNKNFWKLAVYAFMIYGTVMGMQGLWATPYMQNVYGIEKQVAANNLMFWAIGMALGCVVVGIFSDRILKSRRKACLYFSIVYLITWIPLVAAPGTWPVGLLWLQMFIMGFFCGAYVPNYAHISEDMPHGAIATASAMVNVFYFIGGAVFQTIMGRMLDSYGADESGAFSVEAYRSTFVFCFVAMIVACVMMFLTTDTQAVKRSKESATA